MTDVVIVNLPKMLGHYLPAAPALLKGACNFLNVSSRVLDFNLEFIDVCQQQNIGVDHCIVGITEDTVPDSELKIVVDQLILQWADTVDKLHPQVVAISVFSYYGRYFAKQLLKNISVPCKVVLGGAGIKDAINGEADFAVRLKQKNLIDMYVIDDGEIVFPQLIAKYLNITCPDIDPNSLNIPYFPDYSDYDISMYGQKNQIYVPVTGSRGCVRTCDFCEIHQHWRFRQRSAEHIAQELKLILKGISNPHFHFTDSLVNGSLSEFNNLLDFMIELQQEYNFSWGGQFIIREPDQFPEKVWRKIGQSNAKRLEIGVETGSERLRYQMNKPFTNLALDFSIHMMEKYNITSVLLFFIGYPLETEQDFSDTLDLLTKYQNNRTIESIQLGYSMAVMPGTPLNTNKKSYGLITTKNPTIWISTQNPTLTYSKRLARRQQISDHAKALGYSLSFDNDFAIQEHQYNLQTFQNEIKILETLIKA